MSTRAYVGYFIDTAPSKIEKNGDVWRRAKVVYQHWDGYPDGLGCTLWYMANFQNELKEISYPNPSAESPVLSNSLDNVSINFERTQRTMYEKWLSRWTLLKQVLKLLPDDQRLTMLMKYIVDANPKGWSSLGHLESYADFNNSDEHSNTLVEIDVHRTETQEENVYFHFSPMIDAWEEFVYLVDTELKTVTVMIKRLGAAGPFLGIANDAPFYEHPYYQEIPAIDLSMKDWNYKMQECEED